MHPEENLKKCPNVFTTKKRNHMQVDTQQLIPADILVRQTEHTGTLYDRQLWSETIPLITTLLKIPAFHSAVQIIPLRTTTPFLRSPF